MHGVGQKDQVPEHPAEIDEADHRQGDHLKLALGPVAQDRNEQNEGNDINGQRHEQAVPARVVLVGVLDERNDPGGNNSQVDGAGHEPILVETGGTRELLEAERGHDREEGDGDGAAEKDAAKPQRHHQEPAPVGAPGVVDVLVQSPLQQGERRPGHNQQPGRNGQVETEDRAFEGCLGRHA